MKKIFIFIVLLVILGILVFLYVNKNKLFPQQMTKISIQLNWVHNAQFAGLYVAKEKGFYADEGLDVDIKPYQDGLDQGEELSNGKVTYSIYTPIEMLADIAKGDKFKAIAAIYQTTPLALVSLKSSNIKSPADFKGKVLGAKGGNRQAELTYPTLANNFGVSPKSYTIKDLDFSVDEGDDIVRKRADMVDLYRTDQVYFLNQRGIPYSLMFPEDYGFKSYGDTIVTTQQQINNNPDQVRRFVRATQEGWAYALSHPQEALAMTKKYEDKLYNDPQHEAYILEKSTPLIQPTGNEPIGAMDVVAWNNAINAMKIENVLQAPITPSDVYTTQFLEDK